jgi:SCP-2 sterol transfer family
MRLIADVPTIYGVVTGKLDAQAARADGRLRIEGDAESLNRMRATFPVARAQRAPVISV